MQSAEYTATPYILTTYTSDAGCRVCGRNWKCGLRDCGWSPRVTSRRAVGSLIEAQHGVDLFIEDHGGSVDEYADVAEHGGLVTLPDGAIIRVRRTDWLGLERETFDMPWYPGTAWPTNVANDPQRKGSGFPAERVAAARGEILDAFNERFTS